MKMTKEMRLKMVEDGPELMQAIFKTAVEGRGWGFLPDSKGELRIPPFLGRAVDIVNRTTGVKAYELLSYMLCSIERLRRKSEIFFDLQPRVFYFSKVESNIALSRLQQAVAGHYMLQLVPDRPACPAFIGMFVEALDETWPCDAAEDEPSGEMFRVRQEVLDDFFRLVAEMREVIVVLAKTLERAGAK